MLHDINMLTHTPSQSVALTFLVLERLDKFHPLSLCGKEQLRHSEKHLPLCSTKSSHTV